MIQRILIIDDEEVWGSLTKRMLAIQIPGCVVETANNGVTGIEKARTFQPQVIILDVMLSSENGWEIATSLKNDPATQAIPIIVASGAGSPFSKDQHIEHDLIAEYIRKPFDIQALQDAIQRVIKA